MFADGIVKIIKSLNACSTALFLSEYIVLNKTGRQTPNNRTIAIIVKRNFFIDDFVFLPPSSLLIIITS